MLENPSLRRLLVVLLTPLFALVERKLGIGLPESTIDLIVGLAIFYIVGSNAKEVAIKRAELAAGEAADKVDESNAAAVIKAAANPETK